MESSELIYSGGLKLKEDYFLPEPPEYEWVREGTSMWIFEENGAFALPRLGIEAEPWTWNNRRCNANAVFASGRVLLIAGIEEMMPCFDDKGVPAILGAGPLAFQCLEPFKSWRVSFDGTAIDSHVENQISRSLDTQKRVPLSYSIDLSMATPAFVQDTSPEKFFKWGKGKQRDAMSVGLGWRLEQLMRGKGEIVVDGEKRSFNALGLRIKRRSIRTDGLFLRGHCWQAAVFPDGRGFAYLSYPPHDDGNEPWNEGFIYQDGRMYPARAVNQPWLKNIMPSGDDVSVELQSELGVTRIEGKTTLSTFRLSNPDIWGLNLHQGGAEYIWGNQKAIGMIERSSLSKPDD